MTPACASFQDHGNFREFLPTFLAAESNTWGYQVGDGLVRGKVNRQILETVFGEPLMASIAAFNRKRATSTLLRDDDDDDDAGEEDEKQGDGEENFVGTKDTAGELQVPYTQTREH